MSILPWRDDRRKEIRIVRSAKLSPHLRWVIFDRNGCPIDSEHISTIYLDWVKDKPEYGERFTHREILEQMLAAYDLPEIDETILYAVKLGASKADTA